MKWTPIVSAALLSVAVAAPAWAAPYGMAGCGLGSQLISSNGIMQTLAATTNGTFGTQTFGITTGTSNCVRSGVVLASKEQEAFFEANFDRIQTDIAQGGGAHLAALGSMFGCTEDVQGAMFSLAQKNYEAVYPTDATTPAQALYALKIALAQDASVAGQCLQL